VAYVDILNRIIAKIEGVSRTSPVGETVGQVKAYHQRVTTKEEFETIFQVDLSYNATKPVRAWVVTWESGRLTRDGAPLNTVFINHTFSVYGWVSFNNDSEALIRELAELIMNTFMTDIRLGLSDPDTYATIVDDSTFAITGFRREQLGDILCSAVEIQITVTERRCSVVFT
jgi:hypothetical protein